MSLLSDVQNGTVAGLEFAKKEIGRGIDAAESGASYVVHHPGEAATNLAKGAYDLVIGDDITTLMSHDPKVTTVDKVLAGVSIASNFVGPEGKLIDKGLSFLAKEALEHGGEDLAKHAAVKLEETLGKDGLAALTKNVDKMAELMKGGLETAEKVLDKLNIASGLKKSLESTFEDLKSTVEDFKAALHATGAERTAAWAKVVKDIGKDGIDIAGDVTNAVKAVHAVHAPAPDKLSKLQQNATHTLLQDAERFKGENGRTFIEGKDLVIDVRTSKDFQKSTHAMLAELQTDATAADKKLVVYAPQISDKEERHLLSEGISVAKTSKDLAKLSLVAHVAGDRGVEIVNLDQRVRNTELMKVVKDVHEKHETLHNAAETTHQVKTLAETRVWSPEMPHEHFKHLMARLQGGSPKPPAHVQTQTQTPGHEHGTSTQTPATTPARKPDLGIGH